MVRHVGPTNRHQEGAYSGVYMDVTKRSSTSALVSSFISISAFTFILMTTACSKKSADSVYNDSFASATCTGQAMENKFIVEWEDGRVTVEQGDDVETFKKTFVKENLENIRLFERDHMIQALHTEVGSSSSSDVNALASTDSWGQDMVQAAALWNQGIQGQNIIVGVVDGFVDVNNA